MTRLFSIVVTFAVLLAASGPASAARGRAKVRTRKTQPPALVDRTSHPRGATGADPFHRNGAVVPGAGHQQPAAVRHVGVARVSAPHPANEALRASAWQHAGRLRAMGQRVWSVMLGVSVSLSMLGGQVGKAISPRPIETLMDNLTSPYVIIGGFVPALVAVTAGQLIRNRYTGRAEAIEASVHESYAADNGLPPP